MCLTMNKINFFKTFVKKATKDHNEAWLESDRDLLRVSAEVSEYQKLTFLSQIENIKLQIKSFHMKNI